MFGRLQTIINNLKSSGKTYGNYDHITKILRMTTLKASKDLKKLSMEELLGTLKVQKMEIIEDEGQRKGKSIALKAQKTQKGSSSKAFKAEESCEVTSDEDYFDEDKLSFISRKIHYKKGSRWKNNNMKHTKEGKDKTQVVCYECKKLGHFKSECPSLDKEK
ncbi:hypothetical protein CR513_53552, partial [Mucuna pruriens]